MLGKHVGRQLLVGNQHRDGDCQIEARATLSFAARREVHGDATIGPRKATRQEGRTHTIATFSAHFIGLTNDGEAGQAGADVHFNVDGATNDTEQCGGTRRCKQRIGPLVLVDEWARHSDECR
jgi:hypothetical protein